MTAPTETPAITVDQIDKRKIRVPFPADPEVLARHLNEAASGDFALTGAACDEGTGLTIVLTREGTP